MAASGSVNYGVEMEFVFAFQEKELLLGNSKIQKELSYGIREQYPEFTPIPATILPNHRYNIWGVMDSGAKEVRPYNMEPQRILQRKLCQTLPRIPTRVFGTIYGPDKTEAKMKYDQWAVTVDHTVCGVGSANIPGSLPNRNIDPREWDSYGLELVSPVLNSANPQHKVDIKQLVEETAGIPDDRHGAFITKQCGLHVHIEAPQILEVLKELATLLVIYEEEISRLHPAVRMPGHRAAANQLDSNRLYFLHGGDLDFDKTKANWVGGNFSTSALKKEYNIPRLRARMSLIKKKEALSQKMCWPSPPDKPNGGRRRLVNFTYLTRGKGYAETIEFRQARGSLDGEEINHWIDFCVGLVKFADFYVHNPDKFPVKSFDDIRQNEGTPANNFGIFKLMRDMDLSESAIQFWYNKIQQYKNCPPGGLDDRSDNEDPPTDDSFDDDFEFEEDLLRKMSFSPNRKRDHDDKRASSVNRGMEDSMGKDILDDLDSFSSSYDSQVIGCVCLRGGGGRKREWVNRDWSYDYSESPNPNSNSFDETYGTRPELAAGIAINLDNSLDVGVPTRQPSLEKLNSNDRMSYELTGPVRRISSGSKKRRRSSNTIQSSERDCEKKRNLPHPLDVQVRPNVDQTWMNQDEDTIVADWRHVQKSQNWQHKGGAYDPPRVNQHQQRYISNPNLFAKPAPPPGSLKYNLEPQPAVSQQPLDKTRGFNQHRQRYISNPNLFAEPAPHPDSLEYDLEPPPVVTQQLLDKTRGFNQHQQRYISNPNLFAEPAPPPDSLEYDLEPPPVVTQQLLDKTRSSYDTQHLPPTQIKKFKAPRKPQQSAQYNQDTGNTIPLPPIGRTKNQEAAIRAGLPGFAPADVDIFAIRAQLDAGVIAVEPMAQDNISWFVSDFDTNQWRVMPTGSRINTSNTVDAQQRCNVCGILALINSFKGQYPNTQYASMDPAFLLEIFDSQVNARRTLTNASDEEMQSLVDLVTGGEFAIVVVNVQDHSKRARRVRHLNLQGHREENLFLRHVPGHWEGMQRILW